MHRELQLYAFFHVCQLHLYLMLIPPRLNFIPFRPFYDMYSFHHGNDVLKNFQLLQRPNMPHELEIMTSISYI